MLPIVRLLVALASSTAIEAVTFQPLPDKPGLVDTGTFGPTLEVVHLFHNDAPIGVTVSKSGRAFVTFNRYVRPSPLARILIGPHQRESHAVPFHTGRARGRQHRSPVPQPRIQHPPWRARQHQLRADRWLERLDAFHQCAGRCHRRPGAPLGARQGPPVC